MLLETFESVKLVVFTFQDFSINIFDENSIFGFATIIFVGCVGGDSFDNFVGENNFTIDGVHIRQQEFLQNVIVFGAGSIEWESHVPFVWIQSISDAAIGRCITAGAVDILFYVIVVVFRNHHK